MKHDNTPVKTWLPPPPPDDFGITLKRWAKKDYYTLRISLRDFRRLQNAGFSGKFALPNARVGGTGDKESRVAEVLAKTLASPNKTIRILMCGKADNPREQFVSLLAAYQKDDLVAIQIEPTQNPNQAKEDEQC